MKKALVLFVVFAMCFICISCSNKVELPAVSVEYEYGDLKEVIVGSAIGCNPSIEATWYSEALKILPAEEQEVAKLYAGKWWNEYVLDETTQKTEYDLIMEENDAFIEVLESLGVKVYQPQELTKQEIIAKYGVEALKNGFSQDFPRDNLVVVGNKIIETTLRTPLRRVDISGLHPILKEKCTNENVEWVSMPQLPLLGDYDQDDALLEGGDVIVIGKTVLVGNTQNTAVGSNENGYKWLKNYLGKDYNVVRVRLREDILHLDCVLSIPKKNTAIIAQDAFIDGIPECLKNYDKINVDVENVKYLLVNGLPINENNYIMGYNSVFDNSELQQALESRGITVHKVYFGTHNAQGGSLRCATQALVRA